jgi:phosphohistidine phosphatase SixA
VRRLELRRHAPRDPAADRLSAMGRAQAEDIGRAAGLIYDAVFVSPATRAAETAAWFLRGAGQQLPDHAVIPGLGGQDASGGSPEGMAVGVRALLERIPEGGIGLAISHTPLVERAAFGLTGREIDPLAECEGILVTEEAGVVEVDEIRIPGGGPDSGG